MRKFIFIILLFATSLAHSQEIFNVILEDTASHIAIDVVEFNNNYYVLSGTHNETLTNCFAISEINSFGDTQWKRLYDNDSLIVRAGWDGCLKIKNDNLMICGTSLDKIGPGQAIHITRLNGQFDIQEQKYILYDSIWKSCYSSFINEAGDVLLTGAYVDTASNDVYMLLIKLNETLELIWSHTFNYDYSYGSKILECKNADIICAGTQSINGYDDWLINRYTTQGDLLWSKRFGWLGSRNDGSVSALTETPDSCILACGGYPGIQTMTDTYYDGCIRKIDKNGDLVWEQRYRNYSGHPTDADKVLSQMEISDCIQLTNGDFIILGSSLSFYTIHRGFLMRVANSGQVKWHKYYYADSLNSAWQYLNSFKQTSDNGFILSGYGNDYSNIGYSPPQQRWLIKTDSLGMDGLCNTAPDALEVDINLPDEMCAFDTTEQYLYIAGPTAPYTVSISNGQQFDSIYYPPVFVPKEIGPSTIEISYDGISTLEFEEPEVTIANHDWGECIAIPIEFHVGNQVGFVNYDITLTDGWGNSKTTSKSVFVETCPDGINDASLNQLQIYPNPASNSITIDLENNHRSLNADIFDASGKLVLSTNITGEQTKIDISTLPPGSYQLVIENTSHNFTVVR
jgi:hypothetical protein